MRTLKKMQWKLRIADANQKIDDAYVEVRENNCNYETRCQGHHGSTIFEVASYLERIGDHIGNVAWVVYNKTGHCRIDLTAEAK